MGYDIAVQSQLAAAACVGRRAQAWVKSVSVLCGEKRVESVWELASSKLGFYQGSFSRVSNTGQLAFASQALSLEPTPACRVLGG